MNRLWKWVLVGIAVAVLAPRDGDSCGPFIADAQFTTYHGPAVQEFAQGQLGVLRPHFYRAALLLAYRTLEGAPLNKEERAKLAHQPSFVDPDREPPRSNPENWLAARAQVPGAAKIENIDTDKKLPGSDYEQYPNCLSNAFEAATATLNERIAKWGAKSPQVAEWLRGQDQVFQNCSAGPSVPKPVTGADALLQADRQYQIAAAKFYAQQFPEATRDFEAIAKNAASPWRDIAPYLAARACIRQATLKDAPDKLEEAAKRLQAIVNDPARKQLRDSADGLLQFVRARLDPDERLVELGNQLMHPGPATDLQRVITDYTSIWDHNEGAEAPVDKSDVAKWIQMFQHGGDTLDVWSKKKQSAAWLVAAIAWAKPEDPMLRNVIAAARAVRPDSPAYATVAYYGILGQIRLNQVDAARKWADEALATKQPESVMNLLRAERLKMARDWTEFMRFTPRKPVAFSYGDGTTMDLPIDFEQEKEAKKVTFDADSVEPMNQVPLPLWIEATKSDLLPKALQADMAQAAWVRAVLLGDGDSARALAERVGQLKPELASHMRAYLAERDAAAAKFTAILLMLRAPGMEPTLREGFGRTTEVLKRDEFRDNWWTLDVRHPDNEPGAEEHDHEALFDLYPNGKFGPSGFLPPQQSAAGEKEWERLKQVGGNAVNYMCSETLAWAKDHAQDERVPEALYLAVQATHYGPADKASSALSKQVFDLLHRRYPSSEWARKTKYWY